MFCFGLILAWKLKVDLALWRKGLPVDHKEEWITVAIMSACTSGLLFAAMSKSFLLSIPVVAGMLMSWFWFLFDGLYNILRDKDWWYTGTDDPDDAKSDDFLQKLELWQHIAIKVGLVLVFTFVYFIFLW